MRTSPVTLPPDAVPEAASYKPLGIEPATSASLDGGARRGRSRRRRWPRAVALAVVLALVLAALVLAMRMRRSPSAEPAETLSTIAVLPFANLSGDAANEYMSDGITDELINTLAGVPGLKVASRTSAFSLKETRLDVREVGKRLGVGVVLEGSLRRSGDRLRVAAQLVGASDGYQLWSQTFDRSADDVLAIQTEIALAIVDNMRGRLGAGQAVLPQADHPTDDPEAYDLYLKGRFAWHKRTETGLRDAVK
jgi:TolB-like protein